MLQQRVRVHSLVSRPALNGRHGVATAFDAATTRYTVQMEGDDGSAISVRPANLELA